MSGPKLILIGLDGAMPDMVRRFLSELPHFRHLIEQGFFSPAWSSPCCDTPTNWTTIVTGSWTGTHGITSFMAHLPGTPVTSEQPTFNSHLCRSEYLWQAAERQGLRSILLNYPVGWPVTLAGGVVIGGDGLFSAQWTQSNALCYHSSAVEGDDEGLVEFIPVSEWPNLPLHQRALQTSFHMAGGGRAVWDQAGLQKERGLSQGMSNVPDFRAAILDVDGSGFDRVLICRGQDGELPVANLTVGQWSDWVIGRFGQDGAECAFRFRLLELSPDGTRFRLQRTIAGKTSGWSYPVDVAADLVQHVGPYIEGFELAQGLRSQGDESFYLDQMQLQCDWTARAAEHLVSEYGCDLLFVQLHTIDGPNHMWLAHVSPESCKYDPQRADYYWDLFRRDYRMCDDMIGRIAACGGPDTVVAVVSDHGAVYTDKVVWTAGALVQKGLLTYVPTKRPGVYKIDSARSKVRPTNVNYIWVNLKGREEGGIVDPGPEYEMVCNQVIEALYALRDPQTGVCPVALAIKKEEARQFGQYGDRVGDIVYYLRPGYTDYPCGTRELNLDTHSFADPWMLLMGGGFAEAKVHSGIHHSHLPYAHCEVASNQAVFMAMGPGIGAGTQANHINLVDVTPTLCHLLGIRPPLQSEGRIISEMLSC
jgi:predicted AlkP superfamily phosphohydrolase/phosphomutase